MRKACYHLPGLFEFYELYEMFLPLFYGHREWFYEESEIASVYGAPEGCIWGGGRPGGTYRNPQKMLDLVNGYGISARLTFSNSLLQSEHLEDPFCNALCERFSQSIKAENGVIVHSDLLAEYLKQKYPNLYLVSSTTKVLTDTQKFLQELQREDFRYVVPDFRMNKRFDVLEGLSFEEKEKVEFLVNEACWFGCTDRKACYENVSRQNLEESYPDFVCKAPGGGEGYRFSKAMQNPGFISAKDIRDIYLPMGFSNFKIEGRSLGSALVLEFLLYYLTKPEYQLQVREEVYLSNTLDLF